MVPIANVTAAVFAAYLKCPTKAYFTAHGETPPDTFLADTRARIWAAYKAEACHDLEMRSTDVASIDFLGVTNHPARDVANLFVDCETASYACDQSRLTRKGLLRKRAEGRCEFVPVLYSPWDKSDQSDDLLVCLGALAIGQATGGGIPPLGRVIYGGGHRGKNIRIADHVSKTREVIEAIASICQASGPPPLVLNPTSPIRAL
jgi:hypothetical protein